MTIRNEAMRGHINKLWSFRMRALIFALLVLVLLNTHYYSDYQTTLLPGVYIQDSDSDLKAGHWSVPLVFDWNDDGKKDLLAGSSYTDDNGRASGRVHFYQNRGADSKPSFKGHTLIHTCTDICSPINAAASG
ncbi:MAG: hypothetical protein HZC49_04885 [Nitrospirae bacterium]|nr:hypothetical protein [Nitrospirota bacterium]